MSRARIDLYWWSPWRNLRTAGWELRTNRAAWATMTAHGGRSFQNFGDELSRKIVSEVSGRGVRWAPPADAAVTAIGSVLEHVAADDGPGLIWGSGLRRPEFAPSAWALRRPSRFLAVRGVLTRDALGLSEELPLGDPGLIVRSMYQRSRRPRGVVVVPHFLAFNDPDARRQLAAARSLGLRVLAPSANHARICEEVSRAELTLSSSLHGMVVADALDCPVQLVSFGRTAEPAFKFADYQSIYGLPTEFASFGESVLGRATGHLRQTAELRGDTVGARIDDVVQRLTLSGEALADLG